MKEYIKDMKPEEVIKRLKNGEILKMNDRFKFRIPFYSNENNFLGFEYIEVLEGLDAYNYGTCYHGGPEQCTGFKDENGKLVYEEDIVETNTKTNFEKCLVLWDEDDASFWLESIATGKRYPFYCSVIHKVLGNINENPELLGGM